MSKNEPRIHTCTTCGHRGPWDDQWQWYGSYKDIDDGKPIIKSCSEKCRKKARRRGGEG